MKRLNFYALRRDILLVLESVERVTNIQYARMINAPSAAVEVFRRAVEIPTLGQADRETGSTCDSYLVLEATARVYTRAVRGTGGIERLCIDQLSNPDSLILMPAGMWKEDVVLGGMIGTASQSPVARMLLKRFEAVFRKSFCRVGAYWVGPDAMELLRTGKRLTASVQSPPEYDLRI